MAIIAVKKLLGPFVSLLCFWVAPSGAKVARVEGYIRKDGTDVASDTHTVPNKTRDNNYSLGGVYPTGPVHMKARKIIAWQQV